MGAVILVQLCRADVPVCLVLQAAKWWVSPGHNIPNADQLPWTEHQGSRITMQMRCTVDDFSSQINCTNLVGAMCLVNLVTASTAHPLISAVYEGPRMNGAHCTIL